MKWPRGAAVARFDYDDQFIVEVCESAESDAFDRPYIACYAVEHGGHLECRVSRLVPLTPLARDLLAVAREGR